jgi:Ca-activated chloride channel family protein
MSPRLVIAWMLSGGMVTMGHVGRDPSLSADQAGATPVFSARSDLVVLHATARDRRGAYVTGLPADAFAVFEDGERQTIQFFGIQDRPVTVGLLIDSSGSMRASRDRVIAAAGAFVEKSHRDDETFALLFNDTVRAALPGGPPFTRDADTLRAALSAAIVTVGRTAMYDAIAAGLDHVARGTYLTKVLVVVSDGGDNASTTAFEDLLRKVQVSNTVIYTIGFVDPVERDANPKRLRQLADASGGEAFRPRDMTEIGGVLGSIANDIRQMYTIGYVPTNTARDSRLRRVRVVARAPGGRDLRVRTRAGYVQAER